MTPSDKNWSHWRFFGRGRGRKKEEDWCQNEGKRPKGGFVSEEER